MIFNMVGGGGGSGATLVVSSPVNVSVTASKDDKSYTKNSGSMGSTTFKGLATGTWTVTIRGNGQTATKTIEITADYAITIAFFSATINITYPANSNCVVTNSGGQTVASDTNTGSSTKTWTATVGATGTYTVTATATDGSGKSKSQTVNITTDGQSENVTLLYGLYLFKSGDGLLSGYSIQSLSAGVGDFSGTDALVWATTSQTDSGNIFQFQPAVDISPYTKLYVELRCTGRYSSSYTNVIIALTEKFRSGESVGTWDTLSKVATKNDAYNTNRHTVSIDVSSISSSSCVTINATAISGEVYNVWFE